MVRSHIGKKKHDFCILKNSDENSITCTGICRNVVFLEISRNYLSTGVPGLQYTGYKATKNEHLTKFLKDVWKFCN